MLLKMRRYTFYENGRDPVKLRNPYMETIRRRGLVSDNGGAPVDTSLSDILTAWGNGRLYFEGHSTLPQQEAVYISGSESSGSLSPDLGEIWVRKVPAAAAKVIARARLWMRTLLTLKLTLRIPRYKV